MAGRGWGAFFAVVGLATGATEKRDFGRVFFLVGPWVGVGVGVKVSVAAAQSVAKEVGAAVAAVVAVAPGREVL